MDNGAKGGLIPSENKRDFAAVPSDVLHSVPVLYAQPSAAALKALRISGNTSGLLVVAGGTTGCRNVVQ